MRIVDLAKELKITEAFILKKLKVLKLRSKDGLEITGGVEMVLRDALADEGIGKRIVEEVEKSKKVIKKAVKTAVDTVPKKTAASAKKVIKSPAKVDAKPSGKMAKKSPVVEKIIVAKSGPLPKPPPLKAKQS